MGSSFPLDRCGWFGGYVVDDAVHVGHFVNYVVRDPLQYIVWDAGECGCHEVACVHATKGNSVVVGSAVTHDANASNVGENCEVLAFWHIAFSGFAGSLKFASEYPIGFAQDGKLLFCDVANDPYCESRSREWLPIDKGGGKSKFSSKSPHFVFEQ